MSFRDVKFEQIYLMDKQIWPEAGKAEGVGAMNIPAGCPVPVEMVITNHGKTTETVWLGSSMKNALEMVIVGVKNDPINPTHVKVTIPAGATRTINILWIVPETKFGQVLYVRFSVWGYEPVESTWAKGITVSQARGNDEPYDSSGDYWLMVGKQGLVANKVFTAPANPVFDGAGKAAGYLMENFAHYLGDYLPEGYTVLNAFYNDRRRELWVMMNTEVS